MCSTEISMAFPWDALVEKVWFNSCSVSRCLLWYVIFDSNKTSYVLNLE